MNIDNAFPQCSGICDLLQDCGRLSCRANHDTAGPEQVEKKAAIQGKYPSSQRPLFVCRTVIFLNKIAPLDPGFCISLLAWLRSKGHLCASHIGHFARFVSSNRKSTLRLPGQAETWLPLSTLAMQNLGDITISLFPDLHHQLSCYLLTVSPSLHTQLCYKCFTCSQGLLPLGAASFCLTQLISSENAHISSASTTSAVAPSFFSSWFNNDPQSNADNLIVITVFLLSANFCLP